MAENRHLATPHPEWIDFPNNLPSNTQTYIMNRDHNPIVPHPELTITEITLPVRDNTPITLRIYRPKCHKESLPLLVYMHPGGYVTGGLETDDATLRQIALLGLVVVSIQYRLAPDFKFPTGFEDCFDVVRWTASEKGQEELKVDLTKGFLLGGTSAGANFTAGISHLARDEGLNPKFTGLLFLAGSFCHVDARPEKYRPQVLSVDEITEAPGFNRSLIDYFAKMYQAPPTDKRISPLLFDSHYGIAAKAYFVVCGWDPRRDEALLFKDLLSEAGLQTKADVYSGLPHGFWTTAPELDVSKEWLRKLLDAVRWMVE